MEETTWNKLCVRPPQYDPAPCNLSFDLLALKVLSESCVTWATFVPILFFLGLTVLHLTPMWRDRQRDVRQTSDAHHRLMPPPCGCGGIISCIFTDRKVSHHLEGERGHMVSAHYGPHNLIHMIHLRQLISQKLLQKPINVQTVYWDVLHQHTCFSCICICTTNARILFSCVVAMCEQMIITHAR